MCSNEADVFVCMFVCVCVCVFVCVCVKGVSAQCSLEMIVRQLLIICLLFKFCMDILFLKCLILCGNKELQIK